MAYAVVNPFSNFSGRPSASGAGVLVAAANDEFSGEGWLYSSSDGGATWVPRQLVKQYSEDGVIWSGNAFYVDAYDDPYYKVWRSTDGITWTAVFSSTTISRKVVGGGDGNVYIYELSYITYTVANYRSPDGVTLEPLVINLPFNTNGDFGEFTKVIKTSGTSYVGMDYATVFTSPDGLNFTEILFPQFENIFYSAPRNLFFAVIQDPNTYETVFVSSPDLVTLTLITLPQPFNVWSPIFIGSGEYIALVAKSSGETPPDVRIMVPGSLILEQFASDEFGGFLMDYDVYWAPGASPGEFLFTSKDSYPYSLAKITFSTPSSFWTNFKGQYET